MTLNKSESQIVLTRVAKMSLKSVDIYKMYGKPCANIQEQLKNQFSHNCNSLCSKVCFYHNIQEMPSPTCLYAIQYQKAKSNFIHVGRRGIIVLGKTSHLDALFSVTLSLSFMHPHSNSLFDVPGHSACFAWKNSFEEFLHSSFFLGLSPSFECVHAGVASWELVDLFQGRLGQKTAKKILSHLLPMKRF